MFTLEAQEFGESCMEREREGVGVRQRTSFLGWGLLSLLTVGGGGGSSAGGESMKGWTMMTTEPGLPLGSVPKGNRDLFYSDTSARRGGGTKWGEIRVHAVWLHSLRGALPCITLRSSPRKR